MKKIRLISIVLLLFVGLNALAGGYLLITDPSGSVFDLKTEQLQPFFTDYRLPGALLFSFIGILSVLTAIFVTFRSKYHAEWLILQGMIQIGWIAVQVLVFGGFYVPQLIIAAIGILLFVFGIRLRLFLHQGKADRLKH